MGLIVSTLGGWIAATYATIVSTVYTFFVIPVTALVTLPLYKDSQGRRYNIFYLFLLFCALTTFALSALVHGGAFFMIATVIYGWVVLFQKLKEFRKKNK
jgi:hypothetical protein